MDLLKMLLNAGDGGAVRQLSQNFGLEEDQAKSAIAHLLPALGEGLARNAAAPGGLDSLLGALGSGRHAQYFDNLETLGNAETVQDGNGILGHILGSKDVSRGVARQAAAQTGIGEGVLKKMLPVVAAMVMGALAKQGAGSRLQPGSAPASGGGLMDILGQFLGGGQGGSAQGGGILDIVSKLLR